MFLPSVYYVQGTLSFSLTLLLAYLILKYTPPAMKNYGALIFNALLCDLVLSITDSLSVADVITTRIGFIMAFNGRCGSVSSSFCYYCFCFLFLSYYQLVNLNMFSFYLRYRSIKSQPLTYKTVVRICVVLWIMMIAVTNSLVPFCYSDPKETRLAVETIYPNNTYIALHGFGAFGSEVLTLAKYRVVVWLIGAIYSTSFSLFCINFLRWKINKEFRSRQLHLSVSTISLHQSLMKLFLVQMVVPVVLWANCIVLAIDIFVLKVPLMEEYLFLIVGCLPIFNTVVSIYYVRPYRRAVLGALVNRLASQQTKTPSAGITEVNA